MPRVKLSNPNWTQTAISGRAPQYGHDGRITESIPRQPGDVDRERRRVRLAIEDLHERDRERDPDADLGW